VSTGITPKSSGAPQPKKSRARSPAKVEVRQKVKTFQRERPTRHRREEESDAALKSAEAHIEGNRLVCNATCLMKGLRELHGLCRKAVKIVAN
jgi:hypothetical protein